MPPLHCTPASFVWCQMLSHLPLVEPWNLWSEGKSCSECRLEVPAVLCCQITHWQLNLTKRKWPQTPAYQNRSPLQLHMNNLPIFGVLGNRYRVGTWTGPEKSVTQSRWFRTWRKKKGMVFILSSVFCTFFHALYGMHWSSDAEQTFGSTDFFVLAFLKRKGFKYQPPVLIKASSFRKTS